MIESATPSRNPLVEGREDPGLSPGVSGDALIVLYGVVCLLVSAIGSFWIGIRPELGES